MTTFIRLSDIFKFRPGDIVEVDHHSKGKSRIQILSCKPANELYMNRYEFINLTDGELHTTSNRAWHNIYVEANGTLKATGVHKDWLEILYGDNLV